MNCQARQYSDQMQCAACGLAWDTNDPDPPKCSPAAQPVQAAARRQPAEPPPRWITRPASHRLHGRLTVERTHLNAIMLRIEIAEGPIEITTRSLQNPAQLCRQFLLHQWIDRHLERFWSYVHRNDRAGQAAA